MDDKDYKKKYGEPTTLEELLMYAAFISGQGGLEHRTLHHFSYFVSSLIFGQTEYNQFLRMYPDGNPEPKDEFKSLTYDITKGAAEDSLKIYNKYNSLYATCQEKPLLKYAKAFVQYCEDEYGKDDGL